MEGFLWTVLGLILTGLAWLAYHHPRGFRNLAYPLLILPIGFILARTVIIFLTLNHHIPQIADEVSKLEAPSPALEYLATDLAAEWNQAIWILGIGTAAIAYLLFLFFLPMLLSLPVAEDKSKESLPSRTKRE